MFWTRTAPVPNQLMLPFPFQVVQQVTASKQASKRKKERKSSERVNREKNAYVIPSITHTANKRNDMT